VVDGAPPTEPSQEPIRDEDLPDRLRVHQLARALGSTNKEVLDALSALDGRARTVHSGVDREDALRVRDLLFAKPLPNIPGFSSAPAAQQPLVLKSTTNQPHYMPLFVAPQPVETAAGGDSRAGGRDDVGRPTGRGDALDRPGDG